MGKSEYQCFSFSDPEQLDILTVTGSESNCRKDMRKWATGRAEVEGCIKLHSSEAVVCPLPLHNQKVPILCLLDELHHQGYTGHAGVLVHTAISPLQYDSRSPLGKRFYYQALLCRDELFGRCVLQFRSTDPSARFELLLKTKGPIPEGLKAAEYKERVADLKRNKM